MKPFFKDHTSYGAVLAMLLLPPVIAMAFWPDKPGLSKVLWSLAVAFLPWEQCFPSPAGWVSLVVAAVSGC